MFDFIIKLKDWLSGKKTYLVMISGIISALIAWINGAIDTMKFVELLFAAIATMTVRAGVTKSSPNGKG